MKHWICPECGREHSSEDNTLISICVGCSERMEEVEG